MATAYWNGNNSNWGDSDNWSGGSGTGGVPDTGDDIVFPGSNSQSVLTGLDLSAEDFNNITVHRDFGGQIGEVGNPLRCVFSGNFHHNGSQPIHYQADHTGAELSGTVYVNSPNMDGAFHVYGDTDVLRLMAMQGRTKIAGSYSGAITHLMLGRRDQDDQRLAVDIEAGVSNSPIYVQQNGGVLTTQRSLSLTYVHRGQLIVGTGSTGTFSNLDIAPNARCTYLGNGTITALRNAGIFDATDNYSEFTITSLFRLGGGRFLRNPDLVTVSNDYRVISP